jgi:hypothetical protein
MMRIHFYIGIVLLLLISSCSTEITGEGGIETQTYSVATNVTKVSVDDQINVKIMYGVYKKVHVTGYSNLLDYVKVSATGGVIRIGMKPDYTYSGMNITAIVEMPTVTGITATHAGNIEIDSFPNTLNNLLLTTSGSGNINAVAHLQIGALTVNMSNSGSIYLKGSAFNQDVQLSGSGNFDSFDLPVNSATITSSGTGNAFVNPKTDLNVTILSTGNISYKRYPIIISSITGSGLLIDAN